MIVATREVGGVTVIGFSGDFDAVAGREFCEAAEVLGQRARPRILVDFSGVVRITSAGVGALLSTARSLRLAGGALAVIGVRPAVRDLLALTHTDRVLTIYGDLEEAVAQLDAGARPEA